jgi:hypothetical protein
VSYFLASKIQDWSRPLQRSIEKMTGSYLARSTFVDVMVVGILSSLMFAPVMNCSGAQVGCLGYI